MAVSARLKHVYWLIERNAVVGRLFAWIVYSASPDGRPDAAGRERREFMERSLGDRVTALEEQLPRLLNVLARCEAELERLRKENEELRGGPGSAPRL